MFARDQEGLTETRRVRSKTTGVMTHSCVLMFNLYLATYLVLQFVTELDHLVGSVTNQPPERGSRKGTKGHELKKLAYNQSL